jgi:putative DNA primase/helicase
MSNDDWVREVCGLETDADLAGPRPDTRTLQALVKTVEAAEDNAAAVEAIATWLQDEAAVAEVAAAMRVSPTTIMGLVTRLGVRRGLKGHADRALGALRELARRQGLAEREARAALAGPDGVVDTPLAEQLAHPDLPAGLLCPPSWALDARGIREIALDGKTGEPSYTEVASRPLLITARLRDIVDGATSLRVEWPSSRGWTSRVVPRGSVMDARALIGLAGWDAPVHSDNARALVRFAAAFEAANAGAIPEARVSSVMGWQDKGCTAFLWGRSLVREGLELRGESVEELPPSRWREGDVHLLADAGGAELADGFRAAGSWAGWLEVLDAALPYPSLWLGLYAALVPPLMALLPTLPNFIVDFSGPTSMGKTTTLRLAASIWGSPDERAGGILRTWDATRVYIERAAGVLGSLPLFLDDTKRARRPEDVGKTLYDLASGVGRGRGSITGLRDGGRWRTVLLSTGESPATAFTNDAGTRARTLCLWGSPFGGAGTEAVSAVQRIALGTLTHHGHAGPRMVRWLVETPGARAWITESYAAAVDAWTRAAVGHPVASRAAQYVAGLEVAARVLHEVLEVPRPRVDALELAWAAVCEASRDADRPGEALRDVLSWATSQQARFWGRVDSLTTGDEQPPGGWLGTWAGGEHWTQLALLPTELRGFLAREGHDPEAILRTWNDRGWLLDEPPHRTRKVAVAGRKMRCVVLSRAACDAALDDGVD